MSVIMKFVFERLTDPLTLPLSALEQYIVLAMIGFAAYIVAFQLVGSMYSSHFIDTRLAGSIFHWLIRMIVFLGIWATTYIIIVVGRFVYAHWIAALIAVGIVLVVFGGVWLYRRKKATHA